MLKALLRYLFFTAPGIFRRGLEFVLFDKVEITSAYFIYQEQEDKDKKEHNILIKYLEKCRSSQKDS